MDLGFLLSFSLALSSVCLGERPPSRDIPCNNSLDCVPGAKERLYIYSALHEPALREVAVFADFAIKGQDPEEVRVNCTYWKGDYRNSQPITVEATAQRILDEKRIYAPYVIRCPDPIPLFRDLPDWISISTRGNDTGVRVQIEQVDLLKRGTVGACIAPLYSDQFQLFYDWLSHYTALGVEGFHAYWTNSTVAWSSNGMAEGRRTLSEEDIDGKGLPAPFQHPLVQWLRFDHIPTDERFYYSQQSLFNDCIYRNRHTYEFLLMFDIDEFLVIRDARFTQDRSLESLLRHVFPPTFAAVGIYRYAYRDDCSSQDQDWDQEQEEIEVVRTFHERYTHRLQDPESKTVLSSRRYADKLVVKPKRIGIFYVHHLVTVREPFEEGLMNVQPSTAYVKHLRSYGDDCKELTSDAPFDQN